MMMETNSENLFEVKIFDYRHRSFGRCYEFMGAVVENWDRGFLIDMIENSLDRAVSGFVAEFCRSFLIAVLDGKKLKDIFTRLSSASDFKLLRRRSSLETILSLSASGEESRGAILAKSPKVGKSEFGIGFFDLRPLDKDDFNFDDCWDLLDGAFVKFVSGFCHLYLEAEEVKSQICKGEKNNAI